MADTENKAPGPGSEKSGFFSGLRKTRNSFANKLAGIVSTGEKLDPKELDDIEDMLILADIGVSASRSIVESVRETRRLSSADELKNAIRKELLRILEQSEKRLDLDSIDGPCVVLMVGVNGVGKTTTAAKIANHFQRAGHPSMLGACDTFRAAAVEQLQRWGERTDIPVIAHSEASDPAAVAHDAMHAAIAKNASVLVLDTAGRQHSRDDLMRQVEKIQRVVRKVDHEAPHEILITIDAATGQNALSQVENFNRHVPLSGICVAKLDGTAKGGIIVALAEQFSLPIAFVGLGEKIDDLDVFRSAAYVESLVPEN